VDPGGFTSSDEVGKKGVSTDRRIMREGKGGKVRGTWCIPQQGDPARRHVEGGIREGVYLAMKKVSKAKRT